MAALAGYGVRRRQQSLVYIFIQQNAESSTGEQGGSAGLPEEGALRTGLFPLPVPQLDGAYSGALCRVRSGGFS